MSIYNCNLDWFNDISNLNVFPSTEQFLFHLMGPKCKLTVGQKRRLDLLALCTKQYLYASKTLLKIPNIKELQSKIEIQWKIEHCSPTPLDCIDYEPSFLFFFAFLFRFLYINLVCK